MSGWDDAYSDALLAVWRAVGTYDPARGPLANHVDRRVRWALVDGLRRRGGRGEHRRPEDVPLDAAVDLPDETAPDEGDVAVWELARRSVALDPRLPRIVRLRAVDRSYAEIARDLHLSRARIGQLLGLLRERERRAS